MDVKQFDQLYFNIINERRKQDTQIFDEYKDDEKLLKKVMQTRSRQLGVLTNDYQKTRNIILNPNSPEQRCELAYKAFQDVWKN